MYQISNKNKQILRELGRPLDADYPGLHLGLAGARPVPLLLVRAEDQELVEVRREDLS